MKVNHNITAQIANINLKKDERRVATSLERLSSGYKIKRQQMILPEWLFQIRCVPR